MIIARTPFRVSFFGGGTDFPEFFREHNGAVLATAIDRFCYISIHHLAPFFKHRFRASYAKTELVQEPGEFKHPLIRECLVLLDIREGLEITHTSDLPARTGLGSSSSFTVGLLDALHTFCGRSVQAEQLAREAITIERERVGDPGGYQDQYAAAYGGLIRLDFSAAGTKVQQLFLPPDRQAELENNLLMFYTGVEKSAGEILEEQRGRVSKNTAALLEMVAMVEEGQSILHGSGELRQFGSLLHQAWERKRTLAPGITNAQVDAAYDAARGAGALGGKLLGAGGRGFLLLYVEPDRHASVREALQGLREVEFKFSPRGSQIIFQTSP